MAFRRRRYRSFRRISRRYFPRRRMRLRLRRIGYRM